MDGQKISETEALDIIARVFDRNMRRMNYVRGELFIFWGALLSLTALAEYGLYHWTGDVRVLWSWLAPPNSTGGKAPSNRGRSQRC